MLTSPPLWLRTCSEKPYLHVVPQKGVDRYHFAVDMLVQDVKWLGYQKVGLRSDNEPAILKLLAHALSELRIAVRGLEQVFEEHPNSYDSSRATARLRLL